MKKKDYRRINLWLDSELYDQLKKNAGSSYLKVGTYTKQLIQQSINYSIKDNQS